MYEIRRVREHGGNEEARQRRSASETDVRDYQGCDCMAAMRRRDKVRSTVRQDDQEVNDSGKQRSNGVSVWARGSLCERMSTTERGDNGEVWQRCDE